MGVVDVRSVGDWPYADTNRPEMVIRCCSVSAPLLTLSVGLWKLEADSTFMILQPFWLRALIRTGLDCSGSGVALPDCRFARDSAGHASSFSSANFVLSPIDSNALSDRLFQSFDNCSLETVFPEDGPVA